MKRKLTPFVIIGVFWFMLFLFFVAGFSGNLGFAAITGYATLEDGSPTPVGVQSIIIMVLFFTNLVTIFFLIREINSKR